MRRVLCTFAAFAVTVAMSTAASANLIAEWNYNAGTSPGDASTGVGTSSGFFFPFTSSLPVQTGSPNDLNPVIVNGGPNNASGPRSGPNPGEAPGIRVARWNTSTAGGNSPVITYDVLQGYRASRYYQMEVTYDGTNFVSLPAGGTGSSISGAFGTATIDSTGLIDIRTIDGLIDDGTGTGYLHDLTYSFPAGSAADNNPNFGVRIFATWDPGGSDFVSSFAGTDSTDTVSGYIRNTSLGGNQTRYDLMRISAVPEPTTAALALGALALLGLQRRK